MDDFIYVLIGIIWLAFSVIKGSQKKKAAMAKRPAAEESTSQNSTFEEIMAEILGTNEVKPTQQNQTFEPLVEEVVEEEEVGNAYQSLEDLYLKERLNNKQELQIEKPENNNLEPQILKRISREQQFDLRKAIIYQTILERPYA
jgi:hypothetical protein